MTDTKCRAEGVLRLSYQAKPTQPRARKLISEKTLGFFYNTFFFITQGFLEGFSHSLPNAAELPRQNREVTSSQGEPPRPWGSQFSAGCVDKSQAWFKASIPQPETSQPALGFPFPPLLCLWERTLKLIYKAIAFTVAFT